MEAKCVIMQQARLIGNHGWVGRQKLHEVLDIGWGGYFGERMILLKVRYNAGGHYNVPLSEVIAGRYSFV